MLDPQLAAGSLPTEAGWRFLAEEKGYKTVIDLRPRSEISAGDDALAHNLGLRYIILPVTADTLDEAYLRRFEQEIQQDRRAAALTCLTATVRVPPSCGICTRW